MYGLRTYPACQGRELLVGEIVFSALTPHPPLLIPEVGRANLRAVVRTQEAMRVMAGSLVEAQPDVVLVFSPHGPVQRDAVALCSASRVEGDFGDFGAPQVRLGFETDLELVGRISREARRDGLGTMEIRAGPLGHQDAGSQLDYATLVPLYYIREHLAGVGVAKTAPRLVAIAMAMLPYRDLYRFGTSLQRAIAATDKRVAVVASGDLSHRLTRDAPAGYDPAGRVFDESLLDKLARMDVKSILALTPELVDRAGECGLRPLIMLLGCLDGLRGQARVLSYEGPFGVGYAVVSFTLGMPDPPLVKLARRAVHEFVLTGTIIEPPPELLLPEELRRPAGTFVSIKRAGELRGCIGTVTPTQPDIAREVIMNAIHAAVHDPRFPPLGPGELGGLDYSVDILMPAVPVDSLDELDPERFGIIVSKGKRTGLLLPDLEGVHTVEEQVSIAKRKAGIGANEDVEIERFEVIRYRS